MKRSKLTALSFAVLLALAIVPAAWAHSFVDHCTPEVGASLQQVPAQIVCVFTEAVDAKQTKFTVTDASSTRVDNNDVKADPNDNKGLTVIVALNAAKITGGQYTVKWSTVSADGDPTDGQWQFSVNAQPVPSITLVSPAMDTVFDTDPSDVPVTVKVANFALGQGGRRWQVYLDGNLVAQVTDGSTTTTLKGVKKGDYALKVALATDDKTIVATAGNHLGVGLAAMTPAPPTTQPTTTAPTTLPQTGADMAGWLPPGLALVLVLLGIMTIGLGRSVRRTPSSCTQIKVPARMRTLGGSPAEGKSSLESPSDPGRRDVGTLGASSAQSRSGTGKENQ